jgi:hypothetical protein
MACFPGSSFLPPFARGRTFGRARDGNCLNLRKFLGETVLFLSISLVVTVSWKLKGERGRSSEICALRGFRSCALHFLNHDQKAQISGLFTSTPPSDSESREIGRTSKAGQYPLHSPTNKRTNGRKGIRPGSEKCRAECRI